MVINTCHKGSVRGQKQRQILFSADWFLLLIPLSYFVDLPFFKPTSPLIWNDSSGLETPCLSITKHNQNEHSKVNN